MTTTESRWSDYADDLERIILPDDNNVTDPEYIVAYLQQALARAQAVADDGDENVRWARHAGSLMGSIGDFAKRIRMHTPAAIEYAEVLADRTGLRWSRFADFVSDATIPRAAEVARTLGLTETRRSSDLVEWVGEVDGWPVNLFGIATQETP